MPLAPDSVHACCTRPFSPSPFCRVHRLGANNLGPEAGMALAEALKSNTTLRTLESAALPSNPPSHAQGHASVHFIPFLGP